MAAHSALSCDQARLALSARLDGEPLGVPADHLGSHLDVCRACGEWLSRAEQVTRLVRVQPARVPDLTDAILAAIVTDRAERAEQATARPAPRAGARPRAVAGPRRPALARVLQAGIAAVAAMQLLEVMPIMLGIGANGHASHEAGAFAAAVAAAFLLAAFQPRLARAYTPIAVVLAICLTATSGLDIGEHRVTALHEIGGHFGTVIQAFLIFALGRLYASPADSRSDRSSASDPARLVA
ncbi:hypothetical protein HC031_01800 [Planosporangium thailandense]|uniref:Zinc-finger domain-containing protein n=1 Tax=Planosporangium thailandense TaxID=765197 RepID=A0ABX0XRP7_9ACTN|nr:zf-HC2 domain-containing protein [Planosporangium thailandense]NJC68463.1 hypothetical protein [Planosporangium thailandense]